MCHFSEPPPPLPIAPYKLSARSGAPRSKTGQKDFCTFRCTEKDVSWHVFFPFPADSPLLLSWEAMGSLCAPLSLLIPTSVTRLKGSQGPKLP